MTHLYFFFLFVPAVTSLIVVLALLHECLSRWRPGPRSGAEKKAVALLRSWLTPEQDKQWTARSEFEVIGCDTGTRYRITHKAVLNVHQLDPAGRTVAQWCFAPEGALAPGDILLAQKIALETMERKALALANRQALALVSWCPSPGREDVVTQGLTSAGGRRRL
jgi:hypothetical protein